MLTLFRNFFAPPRDLVLLIIAAWIGLWLAEQRCERRGISKNDLSNLAFYTVIAFLLGGRVTFALQNIAVFAKSPLDLFSINADLFDTLGGLAAALIAGMIYGQRRQLALWDVLDGLTPLLAILLAGLGFSHLAAGTAFGRPANVPWAIDLWNASRHPTQAYEIVASAAIFGWVWFGHQDTREGVPFLTFAALAAATRLFIDGYREDGTSLLNGVKQDQLIAWIALAICFVLIEIRIGSIESAGSKPADVGRKRDRRQRT